jgi:adenylate kinase
MDVWVFLGPPGGGKGTQAELLSKERDLAHISTGDLLRTAMEEGTELGKKAKAFVQAGDLVPDDLILDMVREALEGSADRGCILDGYPRNTTQAEALERVLDEAGWKISGVVELQVAEKVLTDRIAGRAAAENRADDTEATVRNRLKVYRDKTAPLTDFYRKRGLLIGIDGEGTIEEIQDRIREATGGAGAAPGRERA